VLPQAKQVLAFSATYRADLLDTLHGLMRSPQHIILSTDTLNVKGLPLFLFPIFHLFNSPFFG
jgi:superfamily II DNA/RNA helicase